MNRVYTKMSILLIVILKRQLTTFQRRCYIPIVLKCHSNNYIITPPVVYSAVEKLSLLNFNFQNAGCSKNKTQLNKDFYDPNWTFAVSTHTIIEGRCRADREGRGHKTHTPHIESGPRAQFNASTHGPPD